jgi:hypothetical protein
MRRYLPLLLALLALLGTATGQTATRELRARRAESEGTKSKLDPKKPLRRNDGADEKGDDDDEDGSGESEYEANDEVAEAPIPPTAAGDDTPEPLIPSEEVKDPKIPKDIKERRKLDNTGDAQDADEGTSVASESGSGSDASSPDASAESGSGSDASA